jgi:hypothetical protein
VTHAQPHQLSSVLGIVLALLAVFVSIPLAQDSRPVDTERLKLQIERALDAAPRNYEQLLAPRQAGVRLLSVDARETPSTQTIAIDLSQRALTYEPSGNIEPLLDKLIEATAATVGSRSLVQYQFTIEGLPVDRVLPRAARFSRQAQSLAAGGAAVVSPGHGVYWDEVLSSWHLQRPRIRGIVEDLVNWDIARYVRDDALLVRNINAQMTRYPDADDKPGPSAVRGGRKRRSTSFRRSGRPTTSGTLASMTTPATSMPVRSTRTGLMRPP